MSTSPNGQWHKDTIARFKTLPTENLYYIRRDAHEAAIAGESIGNPKTGQYWDEVHYASQEIRRREA